MTDPFTIRRIESYSPEMLQQIQAIYDTSFPDKERKPFWMVADGMQRGRYTVLVADDARSSQTVAFAFLLPLRRSQALYIEYLAVRPALRGQGIGSLLLTWMFATLKETPTTAIVWEVDPPDNDADDNARRIRFYERFGAHLIEQSKVYAIPNYYKGSGTLPLRLMWRPLQSDQDQPTKSTLIALITDIYEVEYRGQDRLRDQIIASLDDPA